MAILPVGIGSEEGNFQIERSLRFNSADSAYLSWTPASAGNRRVMTWNLWIKKSSIASANKYLFACNDEYIRFNDTITDTLRVKVASSNLITTQLFRDPSAWGMLTIAVDTTQATASNRVKVYWNGVQITAFGTETYPSQNADATFNTADLHRIGSYAPTAEGFYDGYMAEVHFIDGSALDPTSFGEFNSDTGVWQPKAYTGSYGTNGFYLDFADNSSTTALGYDAAGSNDWTPNNFSVTAGAGNDSLVDTPTPYGTDTGAGGEVRGNYATLNPLEIGSATTLSNGNLENNYSGAATDSMSFSTIAFDVGSSSFYSEFTYVSSSLIGSGVPAVGVASVTTVGTGNISTSGTAVIYHDDGTKTVNGTNSSYGSTWTTGDVIGVGVNNGTITFYKNGTSQGNAATGATGTYKFVIRGRSGTSRTFTIASNFGQRPFAYSAPSGFKALCTQNLPEPDIVDGSQYFDVVTYTGNGTTYSVEAPNFAMDLSWLKMRNAVGSNYIFDRVRGSDKAIWTNRTYEEENTALSPYYTQAFTSTGMDITKDSVGDEVNYLDNTYVTWNWKANGAGVSNTDGTITSTVSANTTSGFSIVTYTGTGSNATVGHGLGAAPKMVIVKTRSNTENWAVWQTGLTSASYHLRLNGTNAQIADIGGGTTVWNGTAPTSTVFSIGSGYNETNGSGLTYVAYCFAPVAGYSAFGSYTGNGSTDGPFVYTGFRPAFVLVKNASSVGKWVLMDTSRGLYNEMTGTNALYPHLSDAEGTDASNRQMDFLSNGFKLRCTGGDANGSGNTIIYMAFAETPFSLSLAR